MKLECPSCGAEMAWNGYRPLFPECTECGETHHVEECKRRS